MDCNTARQTLEVARPGSDDANDPELAVAAAHVDDCPECRAVLEFRQEFDREVSRAMRDVPLPEGLRDRLRAALALSEPVDEIPTAPVAPAAAKSTIRHAGTVPSSASEEAAAIAGAAVRVTSRRRWLAIAATTAAAMVVGTGLWVLVLAPGTPRVTIAEVLEAATRKDLTAADAPEFSGRFEPRLPSPRQMYLPAGLRRAKPKALLDAQGREIAAYYHFRIADRRQRPLDVILVVLDKQTVAPKSLPPAGGTIASGAGKYQSINNVSARVWHDENRVYVCFAQSPDPDVLDLLQPSIYPA